MKMLSEQYASELRQAARMASEWKRRSQNGLRQMKSRVFVVEDHPLMRRSIIEAINRETDLTVCGEAEDAQEAFTAFVTLQPDIVLSDIQLKSSSGLDFIKAVRSSAPGLPIIATTMFDVNRNAQLARAAGATGFVAKQDGPEKMIGAIRELLKAGAGANEVFK